LNRRRKKRNFKLTGGVLFENSFQNGAGLSNQSGAQKRKTSSPFGGKYYQNNHHEFHSVESADRQ
jgi:hypothetical protein